MDIGKLRLRLVGKMAQDAGAKLFGALACRETFHQGEKAAVAHQRPARLRCKRPEVEAGLLQKLAADAAGKAINPVILAFTLKMFVINGLSQKPDCARMRVNT